MTVLADAETLRSRAEIITASPALAALAERLRRLAQPLLTGNVWVPEEKAQLTRDGGWCRRDGHRLDFDPFVGDAHRCPACGEWYAERADYEAWLLWYHLWLIERGVHLGLLAALRDDAEAGRVSAQIVRSYADQYRHYPKRDCVLGPSRLFFSTYLESIWLIGLLSAADLMRVRGEMTPGLDARVKGVADEAADMIAEFDEGRSNRQVWNDVALMAAAAYHDDHSRVERQVSRLTTHLRLGFGRDGMWFEGENYHFFALRAALLGARIAAGCGPDVFHAFGLSGWFTRALDAPLRTVLPDLTFPARRDSPYGVSLRQARFAELWELAIAEDAADRHVAVLHELYDADVDPAPDAGEQEVAEVERNRPGGRLRRDTLSWKALLWMLPDLPPAQTDWRSQSTCLHDQGVAILRRASDRSYLSMEFGAPGGGHGHPDRLHVSFHAAGRAWLADPGTGSYVHDDLFWYRSTLAHNAPMVNGVSQGYAVGRLLGFEDRGRWSWIAAELSEGALAPETRIARTVVRAEDHIFDLVQMRSPHPDVLTVPWHVLGDVHDEEWERVPDGPWESEWPTDIRRAPSPDVGGQPGPWSLAFAPAHVVVHSAEAAGLPMHPPRRFVTASDRGTRVEIASAFATDRPVTVAAAEGTWIVRVGDGPEVRYDVTSDGSVEIVRDDETVAFTTQAGSDPPPPPPGPRSSLRREAMVGPPRAPARFALDRATDYRRAEEAYPGADVFAVNGEVWWRRDALHMALQVRTSDVVPFDPGPDAVRLDNEYPDIHADGVQVYFRWPDGCIRGYVLSLRPAGAVRAREVGSDTIADDVSGRWEQTVEGYGMEVIARAPAPLERGDLVGFDCLVNEMHAERRRRAGQLAWSGGGDWVWLAGDRRDPALFGTLTLT